jgi:hypothetical protein
MPTYGPLSERNNADYRSGIMPGCTFSLEMSPVFCSEASEILVVVKRLAKD